MNETGRRAVVILSLLLIALSIGYRVRGLFWGLPTETRCIRTYMSDESYTVSTVRFMHPERLDFDFNDDSAACLTAFLSPGTIYGSAAMLKVFQLTGLLQVGDRAFFETHLDQADRLYLAARSAILLAACLTLWFVYLGAREIYDRTTGALAAALFALNFVHIFNSFIVENHAVMLMFAALSLYGAARVLQRGGRLRDYLLAGAAAGFAACNALHGGFAVFLLIFAHLARELPAPPARWLGLLFDRRLVLAGVALVAGFVLQYPYFPYHILHSTAQMQEFFTAIGTKFYTETSALAFYWFITPVAVLGLPCALLSLTAVAWRVVKGDLRDRVVACFLAAFLAMLARQSMQHLRYELMLFMPLAWLAAAAILDWLALAGARRWIAAAAVLFALGHYACFTTANFRAVLGPDPRLRASVWLERNVPAGARIATYPLGWTTPPVLQETPPRYAVVVNHYDSAALRREAVPLFVSSAYYREPFMMPLKRLVFTRPFQEQIERYYRETRVFRGEYSFLGVESGDVKYPEYGLLNQAVYIHSCPDTSISASPAP